MGSEDAVLTERHGSVLLVTINRPDARNALDGAVALGVAAAIDELDADDSLFVGVLTGAGGTFSSGMDLKAFLAGESPLVGDRGLCGITMAPPRKPLIGAVEGWAVAGGFELLLACDMVVAAEDARLGVPEVKRALVAGGGAALHLSRRLPLAIALELLLTGDPITASRAAELGLVNRVVAPGEAVGAALELAGVVATNGPLAVAVTKQIARSAPDWSFEEGWKQQEPLMMPVFSSVDAREGAAALAEKRSPEWTGA